MQMPVGFLLPKVKEALIGSLQSCEMENCSHALLLSQSAQAMLGMVKDMRAASISLKDYDEYLPVYRSHDNGLLVIRIDEGLQPGRHLAPLPDHVRPMYDGDDPYLLGTHEEVPTKKTAYITFKDMPVLSDIPNQVSLPKVNGSDILTGIPIVVPMQGNAHDPYDAYRIMVV